VNTKAKESLDNMKVKLPNGTIFIISVFTRGNTKEYLARVIAVLRLINQQGLNMQCRELESSQDS
jgi:hypothetical protein